MNINLSRAWLIAALSLVAVAAAGGVVLGIRLHQISPVEIILERESNIPPVSGVYIEGAVTHPGFYPVSDNTTLHDLFAQATLQTGADTSALRLIAPSIGDNTTVQKISLNRAEPWLLAALPGIGETRAKAISDYRAVHGPFHQIDDLLNVPGISPAVLDRLRPYVTLD